MDCYDHFACGSVVLLNGLKNKYQAIRHIIKNTSAFTGITHKDIFHEAVVQREAELSTGIGKGVAIAHGQTNEVPSTAVAAGISKQGITYHSIDRKPVRILFIIANNPECRQEYLILLSRLVRIVHNEESRVNLLRCPSCDEAGAILNELFRDVVACEHAPVCGR